MKALKVAYLYQGRLKSSAISCVPLIRGTCYQAYVELLATLEAYRYSSLKYGESVVAT